MRPIVERAAGLTPVNFGPPRRRPCTFSCAPPPTRGPARMTQLQRCLAPQVSLSNPLLLSSRPGSATARDDAYALADCSRRCRHPADLADGRCTLGTIQ